MGDGYGAHDGEVDVRGLHDSRLSIDSLGRERNNGVYRRDLHMRDLVGCRLGDDTGWQGSDCLGQGRMLGSLRLLNETQWGDFIEFSKIISSQGRLVSQSRWWNAWVTVGETVMMGKSKLGVRVGGWSGKDLQRDDIVISGDNGGRVFLGVMINVELILLNVGEGGNNSPQYCPRGVNVRVTAFPVKSWISPDPGRPKGRASFGQVIPGGGGQWSVSI